MPLHHRAEGQAIVEFGLVAVLFLSLLFGIFDFGMLLNDWIGVTSAASVGARQAAVGACFAGSATDPATCPGATSVVGAVMQSAPLLATGGNCQNPPQPLDTHNLCVSRVDIAVVDLNVQGAYCRDAEIWLNSQTAQFGSTSTVIRTSGTTWGANTLVGRRGSFSSGANINAYSTITGNTTTTITVAPAFANTPAVGDRFNISTLTLLPITSGWLSCSATTPSPEINDALNVVIRARVELPVALPGLPTDAYAESSATVRFEGAYAP